jgi:hypothetical protein
VRFCPGIERKGWDVRALIAAAVGAVVAVMVALVAVPLADQNGPTTARPLLTSAPAHP